MVNKILTIFLFVFLISLTSALPACSDTNQQDISKVPCIGLTIQINCSGNVSAFNVSNRDINFTIETNTFVDGVYNFTLNLSRGDYELLDCENNSALWEVGLFEQGYGVNMFGIMLPSFLLTILSLVFAGRMFKNFREEDEEEHERKSEEHDEDSFIPKSRLIPIVFMLFSFIPMIFMVGFVNMHLEEYLGGLNVTTFYGFFYILFSSVFYFVFLVSFLVWISSFIKMRRVMKGLDDIE